MRKLFDIIPLFKSFKQSFCKHPGFKNEKVKINGFTRYARLCSRCDLIIQVSSFLNEEE